MVESKFVVLQMIPHTLFIEWDLGALFTELFTNSFTVHGGGGGGGGAVHLLFYCS